MFHVTCNVKLRTKHHLQKPNQRLQCVLCEDLVVFVPRECHWFTSGGWLVHRGPEEIIEVVGFSVVLGVCGD